MLEHQNITSTARQWEVNHIQKVQEFAELVDIPSAKEKIQHFFTSYIAADETDILRIDRKSVCLVYEEVQGLLSHIQELKEMGCFQEGGES